MLQGSSDSVFRKVRTEWLLGGINIDFHPSSGKCVPHGGIDTNRNFENAMKNVILTLRGLESRLHSFKQLDAREYSVLETYNVLDYVKRESAAD